MTLRPLCPTLSPSKAFNLSISILSISASLALSSGVKYFSALIYDSSTFNIDSGSSKG